MSTDMKGTYHLGDRVNVEVSGMEFVVGGNTIWIHSPKGATVLRIQTPMGQKISLNDECLNLVSHADIVSAGPIEICMSSDAKKEQLDPASHKRRHIELHKYMDELCADFLTHNRDKHMSDTTLIELMEWSFKQSKSPSEVQR